MEPLRVLSLGAGVQSTALLLMMLDEDWPDRPTVALFADTGDEPQAVYNHLAWLLETVRGRIILDTVSNGNIALDGYAFARGQNSRWDTPPLYIRNRGRAAGMIHRECTGHYKIEPVKTKAKSMAGPRSIEMWQGISVDEATRMKVNKDPQITNIYPLVWRSLSRWDCERWLVAHGYPIPPKSRCKRCPYQTDPLWREMRDTTPQEWAEAVAFDTAVRRLPGLRGELYLHRSLVPLAEVDLRTRQERGQLDLMPEVDDHPFDAECEGICGV